MRTKHIGAVLLAAATIATASVATSTDASARPFGFRGGGWHGGWHGGFHRGPGFGPVFAGALAFGALAAAPYYYGGYPYYYDECVPRRRIVGYTPWGEPIVRLVRACYY